MMTFDEFEENVRREIEALPEYVKEELNGGVLVDTAEYLHPQAVARDLYILGTYSNTWPYGKQIVLYYGSFMRTMGGAPEDVIRAQIRDTLRHEFLHHMETRAGMFGKGTLIEEDAQRMMRYYMRHAEENADYTK